MNTRPLRTYVKEHWLGLLVGLLLVVLGFLSFRQWGLPFVRKLLSPSSLGKTVQPEKNFKDAFDRYGTFLGLQDVVRLTIVDTTTEYSIVVVENTPPGIGAFKVTPRVPATFDSTDIESRIELDPGSSPEPPSWARMSIATNHLERSWIVSLEELSGEGDVKLSLKDADASATLHVRLPELLPVWRHVHYVNPDAGRVVVGDYELAVGDGIRHNPSERLCGYRILSISGNTLWFQVVYSGKYPSIPRKLWPDLSISLRRLVNGQKFSEVVFESGEAIMPGDRGDFGDGYSIKLDEDGFLYNAGTPFEADGFYAPVRFHYVGPDGAVADVIAVSKNASTNR